VALAIDPGTDRVLAACQTETDYKLGDGDEPVASVAWPIPIHVWAVDADGVAWDYDGDRDVEAVVEEMEDLHSDVLIVEMDAETAVAKFENYMPEQDYEFAETFVPVVRSAA